MPATDSGKRAGPVGVRCAGVQPRGQGQHHGSLFNIGLLYTGLFDARPKDVTGVAVTAGWYSDELNTARDSEGNKDQDYEAVIEVNHKFVLTCGIAITPDIQYLIRPAGTGDINNALVIGGRLSIQF